jgi:hypothetical protein
MIFSEKPVSTFRDHALGVSAFIKIDAMPQMRAALSYRHP